MADRRSAILKRLLMQTVHALNCSAKTPSRAWVRKMRRVNANVRQQMRLMVGVDRAKDGIVSGCVGDTFG